VVLASLAAPLDLALDALLGEAAVAGLRAELAARARRWAAAVAPDRAFEATSPLMAAAALRDHTGPVLLVAADVPGLTAAHAVAALADLREGAEVVYAPSTDGSPYLLALPRPDPALLDRLTEGFAALAQAAADRGGGIGMLGSERRLVAPADAEALAADPAAPEALVLHLRHACSVRRPAT
jgi:CTP:molybdopterin cytidylyltransferase MocA